MGNHGHLETGALQHRGIFAELLWHKDLISILEQVVKARINLLLPLVLRSPLSLVFLDGNCVILQLNLVQVLDCNTEHFGKKSLTISQVWDRSNLSICLLMDLVWKRSIGICLTDTR